MNTSTLFLATVAIWGTTWFAIKYQLDALAPEFGVALRFLVAAVVVLGWCRLRGKPVRMTGVAHAWLAVQGAFGFSLAYVFIYHAERFIVSGLVAVGYAAAPLINMVLSRYFFGTPMAARVGAGGALGLAGIVLVFLPTFVVAVVLQRPWGIAWSMPFVVSLAYLSVVGSVLAFGAYFALLGRIGAARAAYIGVLTPIVALFVSTWLEDFVWRLPTLLGIGLALAGNALALRRSATPAPVESARESR